MRHLPISPRGTRPRENVAAASLLIACVLTLVPSAHAWGFTSSDVPPHNPFVWNDYWAYNRTTPMGDAHNVTITITPELEDNYTFQLVPTNGDRPNPVVDLFEHFLVSHNGILLGDLGPPPHTLPMPVHFRAYETLDFQFQFQIRNLSREEHANLNDQVRAQHEPRSNEISGWLSIVPGNRTCEADSGQACLAVALGLNLGLVYSIPDEALAFTRTEPAATTIPRTGPDGYALLRGSSYSSNLDVRVRVHVTGPLAGHVIEFLVDDLETFIQEIPTAGSASPPAPFVWVPGQSVAEIILPAGNHTLLYRVLVGDDRDLAGAITFEQTGGQFKVVDEFTNAGGSWFEPILAVAILAIAIVVWYGLRRRRRRREQSRPWQSHRASPKRRRGPKPSRLPVARTDHPQAVVNDGDVMRL